MQEAWNLHFYLPRHRLDVGFLESIIEPFQELGCTFSNSTREDSGCTYWDEATFDWLTEPSLPGALKKSIAQGNVMIQLWQIKIGLDIALSVLPTSLVEGIDQLTASPEASGQFSEVTIRFDPIASLIGQTLSKRETEISLFLFELTTRLYNILHPIYGWGDRNEDDQETPTVNVLLGLEIPPMHWLNFLGPSYLRYYEVAPDPNKCPAWKVEHLEDNGILFLLGETKRQSEFFLPTLEYLNKSRSQLA